MTRPLCIELFCGTFGWSAGWLALGGTAIGFDTDHQPWHGPVPANAHLVMQDVRMLHGSQFRGADLILASPPCQRYSYMAMPWTRAKDQANWCRDPAHPERLVELNALFAACFRLQREASEAAGRHIPMVVENVCGAQKWVGRAAWHFGSYYLWGDVPALMPSILRARKNSGGSWFTDGNGATVVRNDPRDGVKVGGLDWNDRSRKGQAFNTHAERQVKEAVKHSATGAAWFDTGPATAGSKSRARRVASAHIARIPYRLSEWIAQCYFPRAEAVA